MLPQDDNCLLLAGVVDGSPGTRHSPAGVPITRFLLKHRSQRHEAGHARDTRARMLVLACGAELSAAAGRLSPGTRVRVRGFVARADHRHAEHRLVLHAEGIQVLDPVPDTATLEASD